MMNNFLMPSHLNVGRIKRALNELAIALVMATTQAHEIIYAALVELHMWRLEVRADPFLAPVVVSRSAVVRHQQVDALECV
jgi:hypothetical protein